MGSYELKELSPDMKDKSDVLHPRSTTGIAKPGTFYEVKKKLGKVHPDDSLWCDAEAWVRHSTTFDFHTPDAFGYVWGLPILVPTYRISSRRHGMRSPAHHSMHGKRGMRVR